MQIRTLKPAFEDVIPRDFQDSGHDSELRISVVYTTREATLKALKAAGALAQGLNARLELIVTEIVPFRLPLECPGVSLEFLGERQESLVTDAGLEVEEVRVEICLCRNAQHALREALAPRSLVLLGGRKKWWVGREQRLEKFLIALGHRVVFISIGARETAEARAQFESHLKLTAQTPRH
jgi:hypothetical protein